MTLRFTIARGVIRLKNFRDKVTELIEIVSLNTRQVAQNNAKLGAVNKVLALWQKQDKEYHEKKENSDRAIEGKLDQIIELLKKK